MGKWQLSLSLALVLKPGKEETDPRPIALTCCIWKIMERNIDDRLVWYLEKNKLLTSV